MGPHAGLGQSEQVLSVGRSLLGYCNVMDGKPSCTHFFLSRYTYG